MRIVRELFLRNDELALNKNQVELARMRSIKTPPSA